MTANTKPFTTRTAAEVCQVTPETIANWVDAGRLRAHRTPGGHRRILPEDLTRFLIEHGMPLPAALDVFQPLRILMIDDDPDYLRFAKEMVQVQFGDRVSVLTCENAIDALVLVGERRPELIMLDIEMPELNGYEACRRLRDLDVTRDVPLVIVTAHFTPETRARALDVGANVVLDKTIGIGALAVEMEAVVGRLFSSR